VGQLKLIYKNCYSLCVDTLEKTDALCVVKYAAGDCAASHSTVSQMQLPATHWVSTEFVLQIIVC